MANKLLHETYYLAMLQSEKKFYYAQRRNIDSVAMLCYRTNQNNQIEFLVLYQPLPETPYKQRWDEPYACPITGSLELNETILETTIRELEEEGGIKVTLDNLKGYNSCVASTQMNETVHCFLFDVTGLDQKPAAGDGSIFEQVSYYQWKSEKELIDILSNNDNGVFLSTLASCYFLYLKVKNKF